MPRQDPIMISKTSNVNPVHDKSVALSIPMQIPLDLGPRITPGIKLTEYRHSSQYVGMKFGAAKTNLKDRPGVIVAATCKLIGENLPTFKYDTLPNLTADNHRFPDWCGLARVPKERLDKDLREVDENLGSMCFKEE
ncbi:uncharacterized protein PgNI_07156 [Pyricularia grisea]|uniref:Uncharacterized protein n=1 Tax=Pyricularia grisea TaxID=148305 RepID=A0A6P8B0G1_PYRGI|nr:uncharacterized protein PgNI_07156 [Pyricularia grisea]TLD08311.1 hypothetical protein PgNI_07156 [Pyricularia grisea]